MVEITMYLIYILALVAVIFIFCLFHERIQMLEYKHKTLKELIDKGYETDNIDLNKYYKK